MTAGYELDTAVRKLGDDLRRLALVVARNKPAGGVSVTDDGGNFTGTPPLSLETVLAEIAALIAAVAVAALDEGVSLTTALDSIDFVGAGVTATVVGDAVTVTIPGVGSASLDDLSDVTITTPAAADRLRYDGTVWRNSALIWRPLTAFDPTTGNYLPLVDPSGNQIMAEA